MPSIITQKRLLMSTLMLSTSGDKPPLTNIARYSSSNRKVLKYQRDSSIRALRSISKRSGLIINALPQQDQPNIVTMIDRYDYEKTACPEREEQTCFTLTMQFNPDSINSFMETNEIKAWGKNDQAHCYGLTRKAQLEHN